MAAGPPVRRTVPRRRAALRAGPTLPAGVATSCAVRPVPATRTTSTGSNARRCSRRRRRCSRRSGRPSRPPSPSAGWRRSIRRSPDVATRSSAGSSCGSRTSTSCGSPAARRAASRSGRCLRHGSTGRRDDGDGGGRLHPGAGRTRSARGRSVPPRRDRHPHRPDDARDGRDAPAELRLRARVGAADARCADRRVRERRAPRRRPSPCRRTRGGDRALRRDLPPTRVDPGDHGPSARRASCPSGPLRALRRGAVRDPALSAGSLHRGHADDLRARREPGRRSAGLPAGGARLPATAALGRAARRLCHEQRARVRADGGRGDPCRAARDHRTRRGDARLEVRSVAPPARLVGATPRSRTSTGASSR